MTEDRSVLERPAPPPDLAWPDADVWLGAGSPDERPLLVLIHGGFWRPDYDRMHLRPLANALCDAGWPVLSLEYPRQPGDPWATADAVRAGLAWVTTDVIMVGHSAGGHLALWAAATAPPPRLCATIALAPVADLRLGERLRLDDGAVADFLGGPAADHAALDPVRLPAPATPVFLVHGAADEVVPPELSRAYAGQHCDAHLTVIPDIGHFAMIDPESRAWPVVLAELARCTVKPH